MSRYSASGAQGEYEPGSNSLVLANKLGVTDAHEMDIIELELLQELYEYIFGKDFPEERLTVELIKTWHFKWLGNVYQWAGDERSVNMSKQGFSFAVATQIPKLLDLFENKVLHHYTPCSSLSSDELIKAIAVTHVEFILIHPFREGNGRIARLLADVMAVQAGFETLDYTSWELNKEEYITAIHRGLDREYDNMKVFVEKALKLN